MMKWSLLPLLLLWWRPSPAETVPIFHGQSLADAQVNLPADLRERVGILVLGFSKKSSLQTKQWNQLLLPDYGNDAYVAYFEGAVLADVPGLIRGMVVKSIRNQMPPKERAHFIPILQDAQKWKQSTRFNSSDDAYILVIDAAGQIKRRFQGAETPDKYRQLKECVAGMQKSVAGQTQHKP